MRSKLRHLLFFIYALLLLQPLCAAESSSAIQVFFSPDGGCTEAVVKAIDNARNTIYVQAYSFTSEPIAEALVRARQRGDQVIVVADKSQLTAKNSMLQCVSEAGIPTYVDKKHAIAHNKIMIIDGHTVITGSFNFTKAAEEKNAENLLIIDSKPLAAEYYDNFLTHERHSEEFTEDAVSDTHKRGRTAKEHKHRSRP